MKQETIDYLNDVFDVMKQIDFTTDFWIAHIQEKGPNLSAFYEACHADECLKLKNLCAEFLKKYE
jgi:hypothetical protein